MALAALRRRLVAGARPRGAPASGAVRALSANVPSVPEGAALRLMGYQICPFCHTVKSVARAADVALAYTEVNPLTKAEIGFSKDHRKVPIAVMDDGAVVVESAAIVDEVLRRSPPASEAFAGAEAREWSAWALRELAVMMYPNITRTYGECKVALAYADAAFSPANAFLVKHVGAFGMSMAHGKIKQKYGIVDERAALMERLAAWEAELGDRPFRGGDRPDLGDVAVFGVLGAVEGLPAREDVVERSPKVGAWIDRVDAALPPARVVV